MEILVVWTKEQDVCKSFDYPATTAGAQSYILPTVVEEAVRVQNVIGAKYCAETLLNCRRRQQNLLFPHNYSEDWTEMAKLLTRPTCSSGTAGSTLLPSPAPSLRPDASQSCKVRS